LAKFRGKIISTDSNKLSVGFKLADVGLVLPAFDSEDFFERAEPLIRRESVKVILPTSGFDIFPYSQHKAALETEGVAVAISDYDVLQLCINKMRLYEVLKNRYDIVYTTKDASEVGFPCFVKPAVGKGSRLAFKCEREVDLEYAMSQQRGDAVVVEPFLPGKEYSVDVFSDLDGRSYFAVPRWRIEVRAGVISKGKVERNLKIEQQSMSIAEFLKIKGPSCMQWKLDEDGKPRLIEINPRLGGGTIISTLAGANFPALILQWIEVGRIDMPSIREITVLRYYEELELECKL
jgi:carbamoyl-phosphate synthase large subunit